MFCFRVSIQLKLLNKNCILIIEYIYRFLITQSKFSFECEHIRWLINSYRNLQKFAKETKTKCIRNVNNATFYWLLYLSEQNATSLISFTLNWGTISKTLEPFENRCISNVVAEQQWCSQGIMRGNGFNSLLKRKISVTSLLFDNYG